MLVKIKNITDREGNPKVDREDMMYSQYIGTLRYYTIAQNYSARLIPLNDKLEVIGHGIWTSCIVMEAMSIEDNCMDVITLNSIYTLEVIDEEFELEC